MTVLCDYMFVNLHVSADGSQRKPYIFLFVCFGTTCLIISLSPFSFSFFRQSLLFVYSVTSRLSEVPWPVYFRHSSVFSLELEYYSTTILSYFLLFYNCHMHQLSMYDIFKHCVFLFSPLPHLQHPPAAPSPCNLPTSYIQGINVSNSFPSSQYIYPQYAFSHWGREHTE